MRNIMRGDYARDYARYYARLNLTVTTDVCSIGWLSRAMMCVCGQRRGCWTGVGQAVQTAREGRVQNKHFAHNVSCPRIMLRIMPRIINTGAHNLRIMYCSVAGAAHNIAHNKCGPRIMLRTMLCIIKNHARIIRA